MRILGKSSRGAAVILQVVLFSLAMISAMNRTREMRSRETAASRLSLAADHWDSSIGPAQTGGSFDVKQSVIAGGGGKSIGGTFQTEDTIGQILIGQASGGSFTVSDGFWTGESMVQNPLPVISGLTPSSVAAGGTAFTLTISGSNFMNGSLVRLNGGNRQTTFVGATQLMAQIPATDIAVAGAAQITVFNPLPGGGSSNVVSLTITPVVSDFTISGRVTYADVGLVAVPGAVVTASSLGTAVSSPPTGSDGRYAIQGVGRGTYRLLAAKSGNVNGITAFDAARILRQRINNEPFLGLQRKAADVDGNDVIDERDALLIGNFIVGKTGSGQTGTWYLEAVNNSTVDVNGNLPDQNFKTALIGDVSGNWSPTNSLTITAVTPVTMNLAHPATGEVVNLQGVTIHGSGFTQGMRVAATFPGGGEMKLSGAQVITVLPDSITVALALNLPGLWTLRVVNADGHASDAFVVRVE